MDSSTSGWQEKEHFSNTPFADIKKLLKQAAKAPSPSSVPILKGASSSPSGAEKQPRCVKSAPTTMQANREKGKPAAGVKTAITQPDVSSDTDQTEFLMAMEGVEPAAWNSSAMEKGVPPRTTAPPARMDEEEKACRKELEAIIQGKKEIPVEHTPEYAEGPQINSNPRIVRKLRSGRFSVQAYCDLHGLTSREALEWCEEFMEHSLEAERSCIAIIHGRGLSSPRGPVLKKLVHEWLTRGKWRHHIIAYSSAPNWDGGPGVTYILLRRKPVRRKKRRKPGLWQD